MRWALAYKNLSCEFTSVNLLNDDTESPEHLRRNPLGYVPALEVMTEKGLICLAESIAILEWLEEVHPNAPLLPSDSFLRARTRQMVEIVNAGTQPLQNLNVLHFYSADPQEQRKWAQHWIRKGLSAFEVLAKETSGRFCIGDDLTWADLALIPQCYNAGRQGLELTDFPRLKKIYEAALLTPSGQASHPDRFEPAQAKS